MVTYDYRGLGSSRGTPAEFKRFTMQQWGEYDLEAVLRWARTTLPGPRRTMIGHSIGGQLLGLTRESEFLDAAAMVAVPRGYWAYWRGPLRYVLRAFWYCVPAGVRVLGHLPLGLVGLEDLPPRVALDWARWGRQREYMSATGQPLSDGFQRVRTPILAISVDDDTTYAPRETVDLLYTLHYSQAPCVRLHIEPAHFELAQLGHSGFFSLRTAHRVWWDQLCTWLKEASAANLRAGLSGDATPHSLQRSLMAPGASRAAAVLG